MPPAEPHRNIFLFSVQAKKQEQQNQEQGGEPPKPVNAAWFGATGMELLLHEFAVIKILVRQAEVAGVSGFRPARALVRTTSGAVLRLVRHKRAAVRTNFGIHQGSFKFRLNLKFKIKNSKLNPPPTPAYSSSVFKSNPIKR